jgi:anti-sigma factor RsiW
MNCETYHDLVAAHVDNVLSTTERQEVEQHLALCQQCRRLFAEESRFRAAFTARRLIVPVPPHVEQHLRAVLAAENAAPSVWERLVPFFTLPRVAVGFAAGLIMALLLPRLISSPSQPVWLTEAVHYYQDVTAGRIPLSYRSADPQVLEADFNRSGQLDFTTHVPDLRPAGYQAAGGYIVNDKNHHIAVVLYHGADGPIICLRQRGMVPPMPAGSEGMKTKYLYTHNGYTISFAQDRDHFCMLISRLSKDAFLRRLAMLSGH